MSRARGRAQTAGLRELAVEKGGSLGLNFSRMGRLFLGLGLVSVLRAACWNKIAPADTLLPPGRFCHSICYVPDCTAIFVLFGEDYRGYAMNDLWYFSLRDSAWREVITDTLTKPVPRMSQSACYVKGLNKIFVFGGKTVSSQPADLNDTWYFDVSTMTWESVAIDTAPAPRSWAGCAYDPVADRIFIFGGYDSSGNALDETWVFNPDSSKWRFVAADTKPHSRGGAGYVYDPNGYRMIMYGGMYALDSGKMSDTWAFNLATFAWDSLETENIPPNKAFFGLVCDSPRNRVITYGGEGTGNGETWMLDLSDLAWSRICDANGGPGYDRITCMAVDAGYHYAYLFSGKGDIHDIPLQDLWALDLSSPDVPEEIADKGLSLSVSPNPAKGNVRIRFTLPGEGPYSLRLYDAAGRMVADLGQARGPASTSFVWEPDVGPGVYFLRLEAGGRALTEKLVIQ